MDQITTNENIKQVGNCVNKLVFGIVIYCVSYLFGTLNLPSTLLMALRLLQGVGIILFILSLIKIGSFKNITNKYFKILFILLLVWHIFVILSNFSISPVFIKTHLREPYYFLQFLIPLVVLLPLNFVIDYFSRWSNRLNLLFFILLFPCFLWIFNYQNFSEQYVWSFGIGAGFIIMNYIYFSKKNQIISLIIVLLCLFISTYMARRNIMLTCCGYLLGALYMYYFYSLSSNIIKKFIFYVIGAIILIMGYLFFLSTQNSLFDKISDRALDNSREEVYFFYIEDMSPVDWVIGKGMNGTYYAPGSDEESPFGTDEDYRFIIEGGYLQIILKGGIINLLLFLFIAIPAIKKGWYQSNNIFSKSSATFVLLWLIDMFPWGMPGFDLRYLIFWLSIGCCYNSEIRMLSDEEVKEYCFPWFNSIK